MNRLLLPEIKLDPCNENNRIIIMYEGPSKEEADKIDLSLIDAYCRGYNVAIPLSIPGDAVMPLRVSVKDVLTVVSDDGEYKVILKGVVA